MISHYLDGTQDNKKFNEIYKKDQYSGLVLRMLKRENSALKKLDEVNLRYQDAIIKFSADGSLFAIYIKDIAQFKVCKVSSMEIENFI